MFGAIGIWRLRAAKTGKDATPAKAMKAARATGFRTARPWAWPGRGSGWAKRALGHDAGWARTRAGPGRWLGWGLGKGGGPGLRVGHALGPHLVQAAQARGETRHRGQGHAQAAQAGHGQDERQGSVPLPRLQPPSPGAGHPAPGRQDVSWERGSGGLPPGGAGARMDYPNFGHIPDRLGRNTREKVTNDLAWLHINGYYLREVF